MDCLKEYVKNIDFGVVDDPEVLCNVYSEIEGHERELVLCPDTTHQMEHLVRKSNAKQILGLVERLDVRRLSSKKLGSRVIEVICDVVFDMVYVQGQAIGIDALVIPIEEELEAKFSDTNATHVIRKLFELVSGKRVSNGRAQSFPARNPAHIEKYKETVIGLIPRLSKEDAFLTLLAYLHCYRSQSAICEIVKHHFTCSRVCEPSMSYFFEKIAGLAGRRARRQMFEEVKDRVADLCRDRYGNYFIGELILHHHEKADYFLESLDLSEFDKSSNIVMKLVHSLLKARSYSNSDRVINAFYLEDSKDIIYNTFGGVEGNFKQKYAPMLCELMKLPAEHGHGINPAFRKSFSSRWIRSKGGVELLQGYYEGADDNKRKREFTKQIEGYLCLIRARRGSEGILKLMAKYGSRKAALEMERSLGAPGTRGQPQATPRIFSV